MGIADVRACYQHWATRSNSGQIPLAFKKWAEADFRNVQGQRVRANRNAAVPESDETEEENQEEEEPGSPEVPDTDVHEDEEVDQVLGAVSDGPSRNSPGKPTPRGQRPVPPASSGTSAQNPPGRHVGSSRMPVASPSLQPSFWDIMPAVTESISGGQVLPPQPGASVKPPRNTPQTPAAHRERLETQVEYLKTLWKDKVYLSLVEDVGNMPVRCI